jgi:hypothetical protein
MADPEWGTGLRGVNGRQAGDYSSKIQMNSQPFAATNFTVKPPELATYDTPNMAQYWKQPGRTSFNRKDLSRPGFVPRVEDF